jgi:tRNA threonylcarbamoyladenosine biosynthesis protein TsaB
MTERNALAIEAATERLSIAVGSGSGVYCRDIVPAREATERVFVHVRDLLDEAGIDFAGLDFVAFGCGPGSFTGVRIAAAAAQAVAFAAGVPLCRVSSLAVLAAACATDRGAVPVAVCLDARMARAYFGLYETTEAGLVVPLRADALIDPMQFDVPADTFVAVGTGWSAYPGLLERHQSRLLRLDPDLLPSARDLLRLAAVDFAAGRTIAPAAALPEYLSPGPAGRAG